MTYQYIKFFEEIGIEDIPLVGGKNASLGEMYQTLVPNGVPVPNGFAITAQAYRYVLQENGIWEALKTLIGELDPHDMDDLQMRGQKARQMIYQAELPEDLKKEIVAAYSDLRQLCGEHISLAVRSSATAEDLPTASFAGQQDTYLNIRGDAAFLDACKRCFASLFTDRAIHYRIDQGFDHFSVALSIGVQQMVRSDLSASGVMFSIDTETGFQEAVFITGAYGLGENVVQGSVDPDEFFVHKPTFKLGARAVLKRHLGSKKIKMVYSSGNTKEPVKNVPTVNAERTRFCISDQEVLKLAEYAIKIEEHYSKQAGYQKPMDMEWAKDGLTGELFIVQARPETVASQVKGSILSSYTLTALDKTLMAAGRAVGAKIGVGRVRVIESVDKLNEFQPGEILVSDTTTPDWEPVMKIASAIVTNRGGRTCHAAIISRELGIPAVVGCDNATEKLKTGDRVTVSCAEGEVGFIYQGELEYQITETDLSDLPIPKTHVMLNLGNPDLAFQHSFLPVSGVGLARMEFIINESIKVHPQALLYPKRIESETVRKQVADLTKGYENGQTYFVEKLSEGIGTIAAAFYPRPVVVRMSDFKSNEYASLLAGQYFEQKEENPMLGYRGAARYIDGEYQPSFALECAAIRRVRETMGLDNVIIMIPFCRRLTEAEQVIEVLGRYGLKRGEKGLQIYMMCEIPNNVLLIDQFADYFDGFSIGTNDLTQLVLGVDRDSSKVASSYDERDEGVKLMIKWAIEGAKRTNKHIGLCGQAPSDYPEMAEFLVDLGIESMSLNPDSVLKTIPLILEKEAKHTVKV
ncbi:phosphoenolpyruvate synthase [Thiomicrospira microaerophila]|uniref:phosphoenolpyruvate synthase n=1 Tax=Thiomicrospira microaerophila TaxID=406020 RepID=UPI00200DAEE1|nr:phosphoenolpyruvate synthase [Thiomicrospira microaerophila]UQB42678.1 phosphoenolpyruvate synthase [Thiomicrospira microaerophila]